MACLRDSWPTSLPASRPHRNPSRVLRPESVSVVRSPVPSLPVPRQTARPLRTMIESPLVRAAPRVWSSQNLSHMGSDERHTSARALLADAEGGEQPVEHVLDVDPAGHGPEGADG